MSNYSNTKKKQSKKSNRGSAIGLILGVVLIAGFIWFIFGVVVPNVSFLFKDNGNTPVNVREEYPIAYEDIVEKYAKEFEIPESVIYAVIYAESHFDNSAVSHAGAHGLMQITYDTFEWLETHLKDGATTDEIYDPDTNIRYGSYYLSYLYGRYGDWRTAYAAYNAGIGSVGAWLEENDGVLGDIPYSETAHYVEKVAAARIEYERILNNK